MKPPFSIRRTVTDLPIPWKLTLIISLFSIVIVALLMLSYIGMNLLSGGRAYVGGEGLWSKAEKGAIYRLTRYALYHENSDYQAYLAHISIPLGDHIARMELAKAAMNQDIVAQGFVQGRNNPADVSLMSFMGHYLYNVPYMHQALVLWGQADEVIAQVPPVAETLHREIASGHPEPARIKAALDQLQAIDNRLTPLEDDFSYTLGAGARWLKGILLAVMLLSTGAFLSVTLIIAFLVSRYLCQEIGHLRRGAARIADGDYSFPLHVHPRDEIGDLSRSFAQMAAQREQAERLKDEFFANVSHELRTPLTLILSPLESLLAGDYGSMDDRVQPALKTMHNNTVRLLQMVNGLLDFSKLEAGQMPVSREPVRIAALTRMVYDDFQPLLRARSLTAELDVGTADVIVLMDHYLYERILFNLLSNAVKFTPAGGRVRVRLNWEHNRLSLTVEDTGIGIPEKELANIFQRFRQVEGSSTRRFEGTGLGLALVEEFAKLLDGTIAVNSGGGKGSVFTMTCSAPAAPETAGTTIQIFPGQRLVSRELPPLPALEHFVPAPDAAQPKVLIAEDNIEMAAYIGNLLHPLCQTRTVANGNRALEMIREWSPDLLLTDVMMPERDGLSLCRAVKADPVTAAMPVVMLTAMTHREALLEGWKAGANEYLFKPFHPRELITRIQSLLESRKSQRQAAEKIAGLNETLRRHALDLEAANKELEAFSYSVSHDLRTPLRAIDGFSKEILTHCETSLDERGKEDLQRIRAAAQRMGQLIDDLLELSHLSRSELHRETVDLAPLAAQVMQGLRDAEPARGPVEFNAAPHAPAQGDRRLLQIVLENLMQNAWKFTAQQAHPKIEFGVMQQAGKKTFFVRDNGTGFNMAYAGKLFKPFQRLHDVKEFPGTGIGLALVHRIVHRHGGEIWAQAQEHEGAAFYFTLS